MEERIKELFCAHIDFISLRPAYVELICREALDNNGYLLSIDSFLEVIQQGKKLIQLAQTEGIITNTDNDSILMYSLGICWFPFLQQHLIAKMLEIDPFSDAFCQQHKEFVTTTFIQGLFYKK